VTVNLFVRYNKNIFDSHGTQHLLSVTRTRQSSNTAEPAISSY